MSIYVNWGKKKCLDCGKEYNTPLDIYGAAAYPHQDCPERQPIDTKDKENDDTR